MKPVLARLLVAAPLALLAGCKAQVPPAAEAGPPAAPPAGATAADPHSFARPAEARVEHLDLDLTVDFPARRLAGRASLRITHAPEATNLVLDTRGLEVRRVSTGADDREVTFRLGAPVPLLGRPLWIDLPPWVELVHVDYATTADSAALQWLEPQQTASGEHPFLFTQSQAILARTWIPLQDTPAVRFTYAATIHAPRGLLAVMSADNPQQASADGVYRFRMPQPIPSYLMALAVGDLVFRPLGKDTGVYAERPVIERAAWELADTQKMVDAAARQWGPYRWGRYDLLVLPPSFPFGGMENPRLTFATPTILAGDRSLVSLVAHELAHSWSGNLVTNATWNDFWLNEGFTVYLEGRIMEELYGRPYAEMLAELGLQDLRDQIAKLPPDDTRLALQLTGRDPDEGMNDVAYEKGALFLRTLEAAVGRERWDPFLRSWFDEHAFRSVTTQDFLRFLDQRLLGPAGKTAEQLQVAAWVDGPGIPANAVLPDSRLLDEVEAELARWREGKPLPRAATAQWSSHQWVHFLRNLPPAVPAARLAELDETFELSASGNSAILSTWLTVAVKNGYRPAYPALEKFLTSMGRRLYLRPLYEALAATPEGKQLARQIYARARPTYHAVATQTIDKILEWNETGAH